MSLESAEDAAVGAAARFTVADAAATIANAAPSDSNAATAVALLLLIRFPPWYYPGPLPHVTTFEPTCCPRTFDWPDCPTDGRPPGCASDRPRSSRCSAPRR